MPYIDAPAGATFSVCRTWRYELWRRWGSADPLVVVGLNPSTADETIDDPTIRRCIGFAKREGLGGLVMLNMYALRSTDPAGLGLVANPVGVDNVETIARWARRPVRMVAAWGAHRAARARDAETVRAIVANRPAGFVLECFGTTAEGFPRHPLYLPKSAPILTYVGFGA